MPVHTEKAAIKNDNIIDEHTSKIFRNRVFDCHLWPDWRQMAIENTVSSDFDRRSLIVKSVFDYCISSVISHSGLRIAKPCRYNIHRSRSSTQPEVGLIIRKWRFVGKSMMVASS